MSRVMIIDDEADLRLLISAGLRDIGHTPISVGDPRRALELASEDPPDAVILDVMMPNLSGWEVLQALRSIPVMAPKPILMLSAIGDSKARAKGIRLGADDFVAKPFDMEELMVRLDSLLAKQQQIPASLSGTLSSHRLSEIAQTLHHLGAGGRLEVRSGRLTGWIDNFGDSLVDARFGSLEGEEAFLAMMTLEEGQFSFSPLSEQEQSERVPTGSKISRLLLEAAWIDDELAVRKEQVPALSSSLFLLKSPEEPPEGLPPLPLDQITKLLGEERGRNAGSLVAAVNSAPHRTLLAIAWLKERGCLGVRIPSGSTTELDVASILESMPNPSAASLEGISREGISPDEASPEGGFTAFVSLPGDGSSEVLPPAELPELGGASGPPKSPEVSAAEREASDSALRDLLQFAAFQGLPLDPLHIAFLVEPDAWEQLESLFKSILPRFPESLQKAELHRVLWSRRGELLLPMKAAPLRLSLELCSGLQTDLLDESFDPSLVIYWKSSKEVEEARAGELKTLAARLPSSVGKLMVGPENGEIVSGWKQEHPPQDFRECLETLARAWD